MGNLVKTELPNGVVETRDYDELNRLKLVKNVKDGVVISSFDYTLDLVGHRRVVQEQNDRKVEYEYDSLYRLTKETITDAVAGNRIVEYTYDAVGNRQAKNDSFEGITTYTYDNNDRLKTEELKQNGVVVETIEYRYDDNGNLISQIKNGVEEVSYTWDKENRLIGVRKANGEVISYQYDSDGIRVSSTVNGVKTEFLVDKNRDYAQVLEERVNNGLIAGYVYGLDLISQQRGSEKSFYLVDGLGSTRGLTNGSGVVTDRYSYDAFGNLIGSTGGTTNNYRFAGEQFDPNLGDYYLRQRYYDTDTGRFTRRDTFEGYRTKPPSLHRYLYADANPITFIDPSGLTSITEVTSARNIADILSSSIRIGGRFLDAVDRVNSVANLINSISQAFQLASNPELFLRNLNTTVQDQINLIEQPNFLEEAAIALQENTGRIINGVITQKLPQERQLIAGYLKDNNSRYAFFAPSIIGGVAIPTPFKIQQKRVDIITSSNPYRLFGMGMIKTGRGRDIPMQFFRMDFGLPHTTSNPNDPNYEAWPDRTNRFHFHIPKNN